MSRKQKIEAMLEKDPADKFLRYALALELEKEGDHERSLRGLLDLAHEDPPHIAAFFMAAQQLTRLERLEEAQAVLREGIEAARQQGDSHAAAEMSEFLQNLA
jgi:thioredoxin-like negative regulator of GroEL